MHTSETLYAMKQQSPTKLYKFMSLGDEIKVRNVLLDSSLYFAKPSQFNDPFEFRPQTMRSDIPGFDPSLTQKYLAPFNDFAHNITMQELDNFGACCFTEDPLHINMWSHYADCHRGICLEFDVGNEFFRRVQKVSYSADRHLLTLKEDHRLDLIFSVMLRKSLSWKYENEWRILTKPGGELVSFDPQILTGVIFGAKCSDLDRDLVRGLLGSRKIRLSNACIDRFEFKLNLNESNGV